MIQKSINPFFELVIKSQDDEIVEETEGTDTTCKEFEVYNECGSATEDTCGSSYRRKREQNSRCISGCYCIDGYVRNSTRTCIPPAECPSRSCLVTEYYNECGPSCDVTCDNYLVRDVSFFQ